MDTGHKILPEYRSIKDIFRYDKTTIMIQIIHIIIYKVKNRLIITSSIIIFQIIYTCRRHYGTIIGKLI